MSYNLFTSPLIEIVSIFFFLLYQPLYHLDPRSGHYMSATAASKLKTGLDSKPKVYVDMSVFYVRCRFYLDFIAFNSFFFHCTYAGKGS